MTEISDDRSWWADVEHLRPGADGPVATRSDPAPLHADAEQEEPRGGHDDAWADDGQPPARRGRITGRPLPARADAEAPAVLRRADAAFLAEAMDLDGAFGAPPRAAESREIVLSGPSPAPAPPVRGAGSPDRRTVRITGNPGIHAEIAERRALREIEARRPRLASERVARHPDRIAMWAVMLGLLLVVIAATSSSGVA